MYCVRTTLHELIRRTGKEKGLKSFKLSRICHGQAATTDQPLWNPQRAVRKANPWEDRGRILGCVLSCSSPAAPCCRPGFLAVCHAGYFCCLQTLAVIWCLLPCSCCATLSSLALLQRALRDKPLGLGKGVAQR